MATRTERIEARIDPELRERLQRAAALAHTSMSGFLVAAAAEKADALLASERRTVVPSEYFDELLAAMDEPPEIVPALVEAAAYARQHGLLTQSDRVS